MLLHVLAVVSALLAITGGFGLDVVTRRQGLPINKLAVALGAAGVSILVALALSSAAIGYQHGVEAGQAAGFDAGYHEADNTINDRGGLSPERVAESMRRIALLRKGQ